MIVLQPLTRIPLTLLYSVDRVCWEQLLEHLEADTHVGMCAIILSMESTKQVVPDEAHRMRVVMSCIGTTNSHWFAPMDMPPRIQWVKNLLAYYDANKPTVQHKPCGA